MTRGSVAWFSMGLWLAMPACWGLSQRWRQVWDFWVIWAVAAAIGLLLWLASQRVEVLARTVNERAGRAETPW